MGTPLIWLNTFLSVLTMVLWCCTEQSFVVIICFVSISCVLGFVNEILIRKRIRKLVEDLERSATVRTLGVFNESLAMFDDQPFEVNTDENTRS